MDDLDAVLASLEHTDTALRTKPTVDVQIVDAPLTQTMTDLDKLLSTNLEAPLTQITTDLDKDFAAELEAISAPPIKKMSLKLDAVHDTFSVQTLDVGVRRKKGKNGKKNTTTARTSNNQKDTEEDEAGMDDISEIEEESVQHKDENLEKLVGTLEYHISQMKFETISAETTISQYSTTKFDSTMTNIDAIERRVHMNITDLHIHNEGAKFYLLQVHTYLDNLQSTNLFDENDKNEAWKKYRNIQQQINDLSNKTYKLIVDLEKISLKMLPFISKEYLTQNKPERDMRVIRSQSESNIVRGFYNGEYGYFKDEQHLNQSSTDKSKNSTEPSLSDQPQEITDEKTKKSVKEVEDSLQELLLQILSTTALILKIDQTIRSLKLRGGKSTEADDLHSESIKQDKILREARSKATITLKKFSRNNRDLHTYISQSQHQYDQLVEKSRNLLRELMTETSRLLNFRTEKYVQEYEQTNRIKKDKLQQTHNYQTYTSDEPEVIYTHRTPTTFATKLTLFTQTLLTLVYPPTPAPTWPSPYKNIVQTQKKSPPPPSKTPPTTLTQTNVVHNKHLVDLCARVAHITAVADQHPLLAALRFALEITPKSPLLIHALKSTPTVLASRAAAEPHTNIVSIRACLTEDKLNRLIRIADTDLNRMRIEEQEILKQLRQTKGNKIPQSVHTKTSRITTHKHNHTHADQHHKHQHQSQLHDDNDSQSSKKSNQTTRSWTFNPFRIFNKADDLVHSYTPRGSNQQTHEDGDVTGTTV